MSRLIDADALYDSYIHEMDNLIKSTVHENADLEALSLLCGAKLITDAPTIDGWISVKDRLPEKSGKYLICAIGDREQRITTAYYGNYFYMTGRITHWRVTHWMPLPELPEEENK